MILILSTRIADIIRIAQTFALTITGVGVVVDVGAAAATAPAAVLRYALADAALLSVLERERDGGRGGGRSTYDAETPMAVRAARRRWVSCIFGRGEAD